MAVPIGKLIEQLTEKKGISVQKFADLLGIKRQSAYDIFKRESLQTDLLQEISMILKVPIGYFFQEGEFVSEPVEEYKKLKEELKQKEKEIEYLKEINQLYKDKESLKNSQTPVPEQKLTSKESPKK